MIRSMKRFIFDSALDLNMGFYHIKQDADAQIQYLVPGYWITRKAIQPIRNKVEAILNIKASKTR
jgi:hypothetical protein